MSGVLSLLSYLPGPSRITPKVSHRNTDGHWVIERNLQAWPRKSTYSSDWQAHVEVLIGYFVLSDMRTTLRVYWRDTPVVPTLANPFPDLQIWSSVVCFYTHVGSDSVHCFPNLELTWAPITGLSSCFHFLLDSSGVALIVNKSGYNGVTCPIRGEVPRILKIKNYLRKQYVVLCLQAGFR